MTKRFQRNRRFAAAILIALLYKTPDLSPRELWKSAVFLLRAFVPWPRRRVDRWLYYRRLRCCFKCPVFYAPLRTCGSPLNPGYESEGCACAMEVKAADPKATCFADEHDILDIGWIENGAE